MNKTIILSCYDNLSVEIEADVVGGVAIHRPVFFEIDENDHLVIENGLPVYKVGDRYWRLTHVSSGLSILNARTKSAALKARQVLRTIDLDRVASLPPNERKYALPNNHPLSVMICDHEVYLPPNWVWNDISPDGGQE